MRKIMTSLLGIGLVLNLNTAKADFPPNCPDLPTAVQWTVNLNHVYARTQKDNWYYYFQDEFQQSDGNYAQLTYYTLYPPTDPLYQIKSMAAAFATPQVVDVPPLKSNEPETASRECVYVGKMNSYGYPMNDSEWHQVITLHYSKEPLVDLHIRTGALPEGLPLPVELVSGSRVYSQEIQTGFDQEFQTVPYGTYTVIAPTTIQIDGRMYQLILQNPYQISPVVMGTNILLLNYQLVAKSK